MKEYEINKNCLPIVQAMFKNRTLAEERNGTGYVKCTDHQKKVMEKNGIKLKEVES